MQKYLGQFASWVGFILSLGFHSALFVVLMLAFKTDNSVDAYAAGVLDTNISMEMMMAMTVEESEPEPVVDPEPEPEPIAKEEVADPTIKLEPPKVEKKKEPEKEKEKPKEKPKEKKKEKPTVKPKEKPQQVNKQAHAVVGERNVVSDATANSHATTTGKGTNPNLAGSGSSGDESTAYRSALRREIERHKRYPQRAKMMRKQGTATVSFNIAADGSISGAKVSKSSGNDDLDNAAVQAVQSAKPIGPRPAGMSSALSVPMSFTIQ